MAVPGPVTSDVSAGCHKIIREWGAVCVTSAHDVIELLTPLDGSPPSSEPVADGRGADQFGQQFLWPDAPAAPATHGQPRAEDNGAVHGQHGPSEASGLPTKGPFPDNDTEGPFPDNDLCTESGAPADSGPHGEVGPHVESGEIGLHDDDGARARSRSPILARDALDKLTTDVLEAVPARGAGPATIAVSAGVGVDAVMRSLGLLAAGGFVERCPRGWRVRRSR
jgi:predicted Rossmann fold nucleotide-binding protein DprA/Smf involved in DNA uptake